MGADCQTLQGRPRERGGSRGRDWPTAVMTVRQHLPWIGDRKSLTRVPQMDGT